MPEIIHCNRSNFKGMLPKGSQVVIVDMNSFDKAMGILNNKGYKDKPLVTPKPSYDKLVAEMTFEQSKLWEKTEKILYVMEL